MILKCYQVHEKDYYAGALETAKDVLDITKKNCCKSITLSGKIETHFLDQ